MANTLTLLVGASLLAAGAFALTRQTPARETARATALRAAVETYGGGTVTNITGSKGKPLLVEPAQWHWGDGFYWYVEVWATGAPHTYQMSEDGKTILTVWHQSLTSLWVAATTILDIVPREGRHGVLALSLM